MIPVMAKSYFPPDFAALDHNLTNFQSLSLGIRLLPDIGSFPNLLLALKQIEDYVEARSTTAPGAVWLRTWCRQEWLA
jgi:hypothetical protein